MDTCHMNSQGRDLIEFCKCVGLLIVNGRVGEDRGIGEFTRVDLYNGFQFSWLCDMFARFI